jgi:hypothetical protein
LASTLGAGMRDAKINDIYQDAGEIDERIGALARIR